MGDAVSVLTGLALWRVVVLVFCGFSACCVLIWRTLLANLSCSFMVVAAPL